jgi:hypothetical protein
LDLDPELFPDEEPPELRPDDPERRLDDPEL